MPDKRRPRPILAIAVTAVWGVLAVPGFLIAAVGAPMAFDAPGSDANPLVWVIVFGFVTFPVACVVSIIASWITWRMTKLPLAMACIPLLSIVTIVGAMALSSEPQSAGPIERVPPPQVPTPQASSLIPIPTVPPESSR
ncbi:MAG: hypothetical protein WAK16_14040 [Candidatus Cybelea sp.]